MVKVREKSPKTPRTLNLEMPSAQRKTPAAQSTNLPNVENNVSEETKFFRSVVEKGIITHLPVIFSVVLAIIISLFVTLLLVLSAALLDGPSEDINSFDLLANCFQIASSTWLIGNGIFTSYNGFALEIIPLGMTLFLFATMFFCFKRKPFAGVMSIALGSLLYTVFSALLYSMNDHSGGLSILVHLPLPFLLCFLALTLANGKGSFFSRVRHFAGSVSEKPAPLWLKNPARAAISAVAALTIISAVFSLVGVFGNLGLQQEIFEQLNAGPWTTIIIAIFQAFLIPNFMIWNMALFFTSGFQFGNFAQFSYTFDFGGSNALPPIPLLGAVNVTENANFPLPLPFIILLFLGALLTLWLVRKNGNERLLFGYTKSRLILGRLAYVALSYLLFCLSLFLLLFLLGYFSSGTVGANFGNIGVNSAMFALDIMSILALGGILVIIGFAIYLVVTIESKKVTNETSVQKAMREDVHKMLEVQKSKEVKARKTKERGSRSVSVTGK